MDDLLAGFPVAICETGWAGRGLVATEDVEVGALVLVSQAAAVAVHRKHLRLMCTRCLVYSADSEVPAPVRCAACAASYCGDACRAADEAMHLPHCHLLARVNADPGLKREEASLVRLLLRMLSQDNSSLRGRASGLDAAQPSAAHVDLMMADSKAFTGFARRKKQRAAAARYFVALLPRAAAQEEPQDTPPRAGDGTASLLASQLAACPSYRSVQAVERRLASGPPNDFACFDIDGEAAGCGFFPSGALINHSCVPNTAVQLQGSALHFYAIQKLRAGDELTQCYTNTGGDGRLTRTQSLKANWGFSCECLRCREDKLKSRSPFLADFDARSICGCGGVMVPEQHRGRRPDSACRCNSWNLRCFDAPRSS